MGFTENQIKFSLRWRSNAFMVYLHTTMLLANNHNRALMRCLQCRTSSSKRWHSEKFPTSEYSLHSVQFIYQPTVCTPDAADKVIHDRHQHIIVSSRVTASVVTASNVTASLVTASHVTASFVTTSPVTVSLVTVGPLVVMNSNHQCGDRSRARARHCLNNL